MGRGSKIQENSWRIKASRRAEENKSLKREVKRLRNVFKPKSKKGKSFKLTV